MRPVNNFYANRKASPASRERVPVRPERKAEPPKREQEKRDE